MSTCCSLNLFFIIKPSNSKTWYTHVQSGIKFMFIPVARHCFLFVCLFVFCCCFWVFVFVFCFFAYYYKYVQISCLKVRDQITFFDHPTYLNFFEILVLIEGSYFSHSHPEIWRFKFGYLWRNNQKRVK